MPNAWQQTIGDILSMNHKHQQALRNTLIWKKNLCTHPQRIPSNNKLSRLLGCLLLIYSTCILCFERHQHDALTQRSSHCLANTNTGQGHLMKWYITTQPHIFLHSRDIVLLQFMSHFRQLRCEINDLRCTNTNKATSRTERGSVGPVCRPSRLQLRRRCWIAWVHHGNPPSQRPTSQQKSNRCKNQRARI